MNRRGFIKQSAILGALAIVAPSIAFSSPRYTLHGDGVTDDAGAIQAWLNGRAVYYADGERVGARLENGTYSLRHSITFENAHDKHIHGCELRLDGPRSLIYATGDRSCSMTNCYIKGNTWN
jgi:hypothetical protein